MKEREHIVENYRMLAELLLCFEANGLTEPSRVGKLQGQKMLLWYWMTDSEREETTRLLGLVPTT